MRFELKLGRPCLSARVETDAPPERRTFLCVRTLDPLPPGEFRVIGSAVLSAGRDVIHLVELLPLPDSRPGVAPVGSAQPWYEVEVDPRAVFGHDAHNILTAILGYDEFARQDPPGEGAAGDRKELAAARGKLEDLVRAALSAATIDEAEASILLRDDFDAAGLLAFGMARASGRARHDPPHRRRRSPGRLVRARRCAGKRARHPGRRERIDRRGGDRAHRNREARCRRRRRHVREPSARARTRRSLRGDARRPGDPALLELHAARDRDARPRARRGRLSAQGGVAGRTRGGHPCRRLRRRLRLEGDPGRGPWRARAARLRGSSRSSPE